MTDVYRIEVASPGLEDADEKGRELMEQAQQQLGFIPTMYAGMAKLSPVLATYMKGYEEFRSHSGFTPAEQEVVFLSISRANDCGYCMAAHSMLADNVSGVPQPVLDAMRNGNSIPDERLAALDELTRVMFHTRGKPSAYSVQRFLSAGYREEQILAIILALAVKTLSNYANHVNQPAVDSAFAGYALNG